MANNDTKGSVVEPMTPSKTGVTLRQYIHNSVYDHIYGITDKVVAVDKTFPIVGHFHRVKINSAGEGFTDSDGADGHVHPIVDGVVKEASGHTHKLKKLVNNKEELYTVLEAENNSLRRYVERTWN